MLAFKDRKSHEIYLHLRIIDKFELQMQPSVSDWSSVALPVRIETPGLPQVWTGYDMDNLYRFIRDRSCY